MLALCNEPLHRKTILITGATSGIGLAAVRVGTYLPLVHVYKSDVLRMCAEAKIPSEIIQSSLKADPDCGRSPEMAEIPIYLIDNHIRGEDVLSPAQKSYINSIIQYNSFKSGLPIC